MVYTSGCGKANEHALHANCKMPVVSTASHKKTTTRISTLREGEEAEIIWRRNSVRQGLSTEGPTRAQWQLKTKQPSPFCCLFPKLEEDSPVGMLYSTFFLKLK